MPFALAMDLYDEWNTRPPINEAILMLVAAYTDWEGERRDTTPEQAAENIHSMGGSVMPMDELPDWMRASLAAWQTETQGKPN